MKKPNNGNLTSTQFNWLFMSLLTWGFFCLSTDRCRDKWPKRDIAECKFNKKPTNLINRIYCINNIIMIRGKSGNLLVWHKNKLMRFWKNGLYFIIFGGKNCKNISFFYFYLLWGIFYQFSNDGIGPTHPMPKLLQLASINLYPRIKLRKCPFGIFSLRPFLAAPTDKKWNFSTAKEFRQSTEIPKFRNFEFPADFFASCSFQPPADRFQLRLEPRITNSIEIIRCTLDE